MDFEEQYILFLEGIYSDDYTDIEDQFKLKILNNVLKQLIG